MPALQRIASLVVVLAVLASAVPSERAPASGRSQTPDAEPRKAKKKKCRKGYVLRTVRKKGKRVWRCRKVRRSPSQERSDQPAFEAPGRRLEGAEAFAFVQRYLFDSTFTDCPERFPNCSVEERYSHTSEGAFYYCRLTLVSGADVINGARAYQVRNAVVEADGSWTFNEIVDNYGNPSFYEWHVAADGTVTGIYQYDGVEQIGPLEYVRGARDCSY